MLKIKVNSELGKKGATLYKQATVHKKAGNMDLAIRAIEMGIDADRAEGLSPAQAYVRLSKFHLASGRKEQAFQVLRDFPDGANPIIEDGLADLFLKNGQHDFTLIHRMVAFFLRVQGMGEKVARAKEFGISMSFEPDVDLAFKKGHLPESLRQVTMNILAEERRNGRRTTAEILRKRLREAIPSN